jgi:hypothetical protein
MAWQKVYYDTSRQDQLTTIAQQDQNGAVQTVTQQRILTLVCVDDGTGGQPTLVAATSASDGTNSVPLVGATYTVEGQPWYVCTQTYPKRTTESPFVFEVQVTYSRKFIIQPEGQTKWNIKLSISGSEFTQTTYKGTDPDTGDDVDIVNSAGQAFDPSVDRSFFDEQITVSYNTLSPPDFSSLRGCTNSDSVSFTIGGVSRSYDVNQLLLKEASMSTTLTLGDGTTPVWAVSCTLIARQDTFTRNILNQGFCEKNDDGDLIQIFDKYTQPLSAPVKLAKDGSKLADGADPVYLKFNIEDQAALSPVFDGLA